MTRRRRMLRRLVAAVVLAVVAVVAASLAGLDPEPLPVVLLALLVVAGLGLVVDGLPQEEVLWYPVPTHPPLSQGSDQATQTHLRRLENHQLSRHPDDTVRDRLAGLADQVLSVRYGVRARSDEGRARLGPELVEVLHGPVVRLNPRRIDRVLRQIEEL